MFHYCIRNNNYELLPSSKVKCKANAKLTKQVANQMKAICNYWTSFLMFIVFRLKETQNTDKNKVGLYKYLDPDMI